MEPKKVRCVVVGDGAVGKTTLVMTYAKNEPPGEYIPYVCESEDVSLTVDGEHYKLTVTDTPAQDGYDRLRPLSYSNMDVFLVCFAINNPTSYENVCLKWVPEIRQYCPDGAILLIGTKLDLREDEDGAGETKEQPAEFVSYEKGRARALKIGAEKYLECSSITRQGLKDVFDEVIRTKVKVTLKAASQKPPNRCRIL